jgi:hypothetical protein
LTPYPWPAMSRTTNSNGTNTDTDGEKRKSRSHSRGRPRGRRRGDQEEPLATRAYHLTPDPSHLSASHPPTTTQFGKRTRHHLPPYFRKGRIPNIAFSRRARISILTVRFLLGVLLGAWASYMCARYWLAYLGQFPLQLFSSPYAHTFPSISYLLLQQEQY